MMYVMQAILAIIIFVCAWMIVDRICRCVEHCATAKAYSKFRECGIAISPGDLEVQIKKIVTESSNLD